ncbi:MAG: hydrogenase maturation protease [Rhodocyclaceae bacterium]|nr:hydrogenase maturation protease [Rhodocyclaceae bacterium]
MRDGAPRVRVIGLGSPFGDDRIGWEVVDRLVESGLPEGVEAVRCENPGRDLLPLLDGAGRAILVDALRGEGRPGEVVRCSRGDLADGPDRWSTHGFGVAAMLDLAASLGSLPGRLEIIGIEAGPVQPASEGFRIGAEVAAGGERLAGMLCAEFAGGEGLFGGASAIPSARLEVIA